MSQRAKYRLGTILMLVAFCNMVFVKSLHHHAVFPAADIICAVDGESLHNHEAHHHDSFIPIIENDDDCAICRYIVVKVEQPPTNTYVHYIGSSTPLFAFSYYLPSQGVYSHLLPRAPPIC